MRIKASKLLAAVLALCLTLGTAPAASAAALPQSAPGSQDITPYFLYIKGQDCILDISGRTAYINAWVSGQTSVATKCKIRAELQEKASAYAWTLVDSWTDQQNGDWAEVDETASVTPRQDLPGQGDRHRLGREPVREQDLLFQRGGGVRHTTKLK